MFFGVTEARISRPWSPKGSEIRVLLRHGGGGTTKMGLIQACTLHPCTRSQVQPNRVISHNLAYMYVAFASLQLLQGTGVADDWPRTSKRPLLTATQGIV